MAETASPVSWVIDHACVCFGRGASAARTGGWSLMKDRGVLSDVMSLPHGLLGSHWAACGHNHLHLSQKRPTQGEGSHADCSGKAGRAGRTGRTDRLSWREENAQQH